MLAGDQAAVLNDFAAPLLAIAGGAPTAAERSGQRVIALWKGGVTL